MDEFRLAQLLNQDISDEKKFEILKNLDISYAVSEKSSVFPEKVVFLGYNCLHIAAIKSDLALTQKLLNLGANVLQQGVQDGKTPLRKAMDYFENNSGTSIWKLKGVLQERPLANALLSAHMKSNNYFNAKCKSGISHLHIACMFNHTPAVLFFARSSESINQAINVDSRLLPGYTPLLCAIRYSSSETAAFLLTLGADIYAKDTRGMNAIHHLIERLLDANDYLMMGRQFTSWTNRYPYEKEIERIDLILKGIVLKIGIDDSKLVENTGLSVFHLACAIRDNWIMQSFIKTGNIQDINKPASCESKFWIGWTPLHFAACLNTESFKILLNNKADVRMKNASGDTAFDLCLQRHVPEKTLKLLPFCMNDDIVLSDKYTKFSNLMLAMSKHSLSKYLERLEDINITLPPESPYCAGYNLLHLSISTNRRVKFSHVFFQELDFNSQVDEHACLPSVYRPGYNNYWLFQDTLKSGCSIYVKNADGLTPIHLAFKLHEWHILDELLACANENFVGPDNVSFLHIACVMGKREVIERLLNEGADVNSPITSSLEWCGKAKSYAEMSKGTKILIRANSTPLHIAVIFKMEESVIELLKKSADVHAQDNLGCTPLHLSLISTKSIAQLLLSGASNLREVKGSNGLSHLHVAAFADDEKAVRKLWQDGADVNSVIKSTVPDCFAAFVDKTPLHLAVEGNKVARFLAIKGANIVAQNPFMSHESPLDIALRNPRKSMFPFEKLNRDKIKVDALSATGLTTLHVACATLDLDWIKKLLERGANPNAQMNDNQGQANTPMHLLIANATSAPNMPANFRLMVELLVEHGADVNISNNFKTPLHSIASAYYHNNVWSLDDKIVLGTIGDWLLSDLGSYVFNHTDVNGFSYFHFACVMNNLAVIKSYLDNGVDVNHSVSPFDDQYGGFTPLHFAVLPRSANAVRLLLNCGADVRAEDMYGDTPLHLAITANFINLNFFDDLLRRGADINAKNLENQTPIVCLLCKNNITYEQFYFFVIRGALLDITESIEGQGIIGLTMRNTIGSDVDLVFETMIGHFNVEDAIRKGFQAIHSIVSILQSGSLTRENYLNAIQKLTGKGSDIDEKDENGKRALDKAISFINIGAIEALLLLGATVNVKYYESHYSPVFFACKSSPFMKNHLQKMALLKLDLNATNPHLNGRHQLDENILQACTSELEKAKNTKICKSLSVKHFLSEWEAVIDYATMPVAKRETVDKFFKRTDDLRKEFPEFSGILTMQYRKAFARVKLMQPVKDILVEAGIDLPDLCLEAILKNFMNDQLILWIEEANEEPCPRKRQRIHS